METKYEYMTPAWASKLICIGFFSVGVMLILLATMRSSSSGSDGLFLRWFIGVIGALFIFASLKPANRKRYLYFSADSKGMKFPSNCQIGGDTLWLNVPWCKVGAIKEETLYSRHKGLSVELKISQDEIDTFFKADDTANRLLDLNNRRNGFFVVGYSKMLFSGFNNAVKTLNEMKRLYT